MLVAVLFQVVSTTSKSAEGEYTDRGESKNDVFGCMFADPGNSDECREDTANPVRKDYSVKV
jgi:hypothetical protein